MQREGCVTVHRETIPSQLGMVCRFAHDDWIIPSFFSSLWRNAAHRTASTAEVQRGPADNAAA